PVVAALKNRYSGTIDGAWGSSAALAAAALGLHAPSTLLVVLAHPRDLDGWTNDLHSFAGLRPVVFPAWDALPSDSGTVDEVARQRLRVLKSLVAGDAPRLLVTTIHALIQPVPDRAQLDQGRRRLAVGDLLTPEDLAAWLVEHGFHPNEAVQLPGDFS